MCSPCPVYLICSSISFSILQLFCSVTLRVASQLLLTEGDWHLCAQLLHLPALQLDRTAGTNICYSCSQGFLLNYLLLDLYNYLTPPVPVRLAHWRFWTISILANACLCWSQARSSLQTCDKHAFRSLCTSFCCASSCWMHGLCCCWLVGQ
jgi:hypothetical protein